MARIGQKGVKRGSFEGIKQGKLTDYLDEMLNGYYQKNNAWPGRIILSQDTNDKIFAELDLDLSLDECWKETRDNYKGIPIYIQKDIFIELKGE